MFVEVFVATQSGGSTVVLFYEINEGFNSLFWGDKYSLLQLNASGLHACIFLL